MSSVIGLVGRHGTQIDKKSDNYLRNVEEMNAAVAELRQNLDLVRSGGGEATVAKHKARGHVVLAFLPGLVPCKHPSNGPQTSHPRVEPKGPRVPHNSCIRV